MISRLRAIPALLALFLAVAAPRDGAAQKSLPTVKEVRIEGLLRIPEASVRTKIQTRAGGTLEPAVVSDDIKRLFRMGTFDDVRVARKDEADGVIVLFLLAERPTINRIRFEGNDAVDNDEIQKVVDARPFEIADEVAIKQILGKIRDLYIEEGYYLADVRYRLDRKPNNMVDVVFEIDEGRKVKVKSITFLGNRALDDEQLKDVMQTREGGWFSFLTSSGQFKQEAFGQDLQRVHLLYLTKGHIHVAVGKPVVTLSPDKQSMDITIHVNEGEPYSVATVDVGGDMLEQKDFEREKLVADLALQPGKVFDYLLMQKDSQQLANKYKDEGYANCTVSNSSIRNDEERTIDFKYIVQMGEKVYIGRIGFEGNETTRDKVMRRVMTIDEGDLYSATELEKSRRMVMRLGFFDKVEVTTDPTDDPKVTDVTVRVKERQTGTFQVGAGFSSLENFIATAQISKQNFLGHGQTLAVQATISSIRSLYTLSFFEPYFLDSLWTFSADLYNFQQDFDDFTRGSTGGSLSWGYRFTEELVLSLAYKLEVVDITIGGLSGRKAIPLANLLGGGLTSSLRTTLSFDTRNDRMFPSAGQYTTASLELAHPYLGSENEFMRVIGRSRWYFNPFWEVVLKLNATIGYVFSIEDKVPIFERFFVGGIYDVRGFQRNSLGPKVEVADLREPGTSLADFTIGGNKELIFNVELEVPILPQVGIRGVLFFDAGNAFHDDEAIDILGLRTSIGWGFRWWSPVGPLRFEWGVPLAPKPGEEDIVFEFTIGNSF